MAVLYIIAAWLIMQVADVVLSLANLPEWAGQVTLGILATGFPIALVFSWFYELTPEGISLEKDVEPGTSITHITGRRMDFIVIAMLSAALLFFAYDKWGTEPAHELSIAVLPFDHSGADGGDAGILATGIQDGLLTRMSQIGSLKVISRTSTERYHDTDKNLKQIATELGVRQILEGGIQQVGDQIRINVQLIDAETDEHIWAETYDRTLAATSVFGVQSEIVETITQRLNAKLTPEEALVLADAPTKDLAAYTEYLRGMKNADIESVESLHAAIENFEAAIELDSNFALAYVGLADAYLALGAYFYGGLSVEESTALAEPPLMRALRLNAGLVEAQASMGMLRQQQGDENAAEQAYENAIALRPNYPRVFRLYGRLRWRQGRTDESIALFERALALDPYSTTINFDVGRIYDETGRFDEALERYLRVIEIEPDHAFAYVYVAAIHYLVNGRVDESLIWYFKAARNDAMSPSLQAGQAIAYLEVGDPENARVWVEKALELGPETFWAVWCSALLNMYVGDNVAAQRDARILLERDPRSWGGLRILRDADIEAGRYDVARSRYARAYRELVEPEVPDVNHWNYFAAIDLALVLMHLGETDRANDMLNGALKVIESRPRLGVSGHWISDVRVYATLHRTEQALAALREAIDAGWRLHTWYYLMLDPNLEAIRGNPKFDALYQIVQSDLARQAENVRNLRASGELASTRHSNRSLR